MSDAPNISQVCTFVLDRMLFGIDVKHVQEVIRHQPMTEVPQAPAMVRGLINLRGQIVTALDMRTLLGIPARATDLSPTNVVVRGAEGVISLLVDEIGDVVEVGASSFEQTPDTLAPRWRELIEGVYKVHPQLLLILNIHRVLCFDASGELKRND